MAGLLDFLRAASNSAASNVSAPVDGIAWLLRKAGLDVGEPTGGSDWMERKGLTRKVSDPVANAVGESAGLIGPMLLAAKAPQVARGLLQMGENAAASRTMSAGLSGGQRGMVPVEFVQNERLFGPSISIDKSGKAIVEKPSAGFESYADIRDRVLQAATEKFGTKYDHQWRFTNNPDELKLARSGSLRKSTNHAQGTAEAGLSVADGLHYGADGYKFGYPVRGSVVGRGSDGETLLDPKTLEVLADQLKTAKELMRMDKAQQAQILKANGLPPDYFDGQVKFLNDMYSFKPR